MPCELKGQNDVSDIEGLNHISTWPRGLVEQKHGRLYRKWLIIYCSTLVLSVNCKSVPLLFKQTLKWFKLSLLFVSSHIRASSSDHTMGSWPWLCWFTCHLTKLTSFKSNIVFVYKMIFYLPKLPPLKKAEVI